MIRRDNFTETANVFRMERLPDSHKQEEVEVLSGIPCHTQPLTGETTEDLTASFGKNWMFFSDIVDIREGDTLEISEKKYRVMGVEVYSWKGRDKFLSAKIRLW